MLMKCSVQLLTNHSQPMVPFIPMFPHILPPVLLTLQPTPPEIVLTIGISACPQAINVMKVETHDIFISIIPEMKDYSISVLYFD